MTEVFKNIGKQWLKVQDLFNPAISNRLRLSIYNSDSKDLRIALSELEPDDDFRGFFLEPFKEYIFPEDLGNIWIKNNSTGIAEVMVTVGQAPSQISSPYPPKIFSGERAITTQNYTEANVKKGLQFEYTNYEASFTGTRDFIIITGDKPVLIKGLVWQFNGLGVSSTIYKNPVYTGGTPQQYFNKNFRNPVLGGVTILGGVTVTNTGIQVSPTKHYLGSTDVGNAVVTTTAREVEGLETLLAPNTEYLFRRVSLDTSPQKIAVYGTWYEGHTDLPEDYPIV